MSDATKVLMDVPNQSTPNYKYNNDFMTYAKYKIKKTTVLVVLLVLSGYSFLNLKLCQNILEYRNPDTHFTNHVYWQTVITCIYTLYLIYMFIVVVEWDCCISIYTDRIIFDDDLLYGKAVIYGGLNFIGQITYYILIKYNGLTGINPKQQWDIGALFNNFGAVFVILFVPIYWIYWELHDRKYRKQYVVNSADYGTISF